MKRAGLFILEDGPFLHECEWLRGAAARAIPGMAQPAAVAVGVLPQLLEALAARIKQCDLIIVAAQPRQFYSLKERLLEALGLPAQADEGIAALQKKYPEDTLFPAGAAVFATPDLRWNGFAMRCGRQHMLVLPLRMDLLEAMEAQLTQYLRAAAGARADRAPARSSVDDVFARLSAYEPIAPLTPDAIVPLAGPQLRPVQSPTKRLPAPQMEPRRVRAARRARRAFAGGLAALFAAGGMFLLAGRMAAASEERQASRAQYQAGDALRLESALLSTTTTAAAAALNADAADPGDAANLAAETPPVIVSSLLLAGQAQEDEARQAVQAVAAMALQAVAETDLPLSVNPLDPSYELDFGQLLLDFIQWLLDLLRAFQDVIVQPETPPTTSPPVQPTALPTSTAQSTAGSTTTSTSTSTTTTTTTTTSTTTTTTTSTTTTAPSPASRGTYSFSAAGYGHGVGMSQEGAIVLANQGKSYEQIIQHYYPGVAVSTDANRPATVNHGGPSYELKEYLARVAYAEIGRCGAGGVPDEAIKAQMICAYTIAKRNNFSTTNTNQVLMASGDWNSNFCKQYHEGMLALAASVLGKYAAYNGQTAETLYFASCAGYTASAQYAWGGNPPLPYLTGGVASPEAVARSTASLTTDQIKSLVSAYNGKYPGKAITLGSDASQWIKVLRTDAYGYVEQIQIGDRVLTGGEARLYFFGTGNLRSHNFTVRFQAG